MSDNTSTSERLFTKEMLGKAFEAGDLRGTNHGLTFEQWYNRFGLPEANDQEKAGREKSDLMRMVSATCDCTDVELNSYEGKDQTVLEIPDSVELRYNAPGAPKRETVTIDTCLVPEIKFLWALGIRTKGCCCGHGIEEGNILVDKRDIPKMEALGYEHWQNPMNPERKDGFIAKTSKLH